MIFRKFDFVFGKAKADTYVKEALATKRALERSLGLIYWYQYQTPGIASSWDKEVSDIKLSYNKLMKTCFKGDPNELEKIARREFDSLCTEHFYSTQKAYDYGVAGMELPR